MNKVIIAIKLVNLAEELIKEAEFVDSDRRTEYFVNPKLQELDSFESGIVRFVAGNDTGNVWVWDGDIRLHSEALKFLGIADNITIDICDRYLFGTVQKEGGKYVMTASDVLDSIIYETNADEKKIYKRVLEDFFDADWRWVDQYFYVSSYLNKMYGIFKEKFKGG